MGEAARSVEAQGDLNVTVYAAAHKVNGLLEQVGKVISDTLWLARETTPLQERLELSRRMLVELKLALYRVKDEAREKAGAPYNEHGVATHPIFCPECGGEGKFERTTCGHSGSCDCTGVYDICERCNGDKIIGDPGCECHKCERLQEEIEVSRGGRSL